MAEQGVGDVHTVLNQGMMTEQGVGDDHILSKEDFDRTGRLMTVILSQSRG